MVTAGGAWRHLFIAAAIEHSIALGPCTRSPQLRFTPPLSKTALPLGRAPDLHNFDLRRRYREQRCPWAVHQISTTSIYAAAIENGPALGPCTRSPQPWPTLRVGRPLNLRGLQKLMTHFASLRGSRAARAHGAYGAWAMRRTDSMRAMRRRMRSRKASRRRASRVLSWRRSGVTAAACRSRR